MNRHGQELCPAQRKNINREAAANFVQESKKYLHSVILNTYLKLTKLVRARALHIGHRSIFIYLRTKDGLWKEATERQSEKRGDDGAAGKKRAGPCKRAALTLYFSAADMVLQKKLRRNKRDLEKPQIHTKLRLAKRVILPASHAVSLQLLLS